ncbi:hypothetical protein N0B51_01360 [Tsuneonella sp. YG55]|uniref:PilZ domain-containing protein n=1 Tax=Tsuneonella litorea TaxID=2976475 RepID=A0A9X2W077_9SPHN|nr:hypothetical protein [Tsuneonella litorea]MCT2557621.1 hypothetical protein [Tsuneonella litorea]
MGIARRPKLATKYTGPRMGERDAVSLEARCRIGDGTVESVAVLDLDARGCRVRGIQVAVTKNEEVALWLGSVGPIAARLRWLKRGSAGLAFEAPLSALQLEEARTTAAPVPGSRVIPLRRSGPAPAG